MQWKLNRLLKFVVIPSPLLLKLKPIGIHPAMPFSQFSGSYETILKRMGVSFKNPISKLD